MVAMADLQC